MPSKYTGKTDRVIAFVEMYELGFGEVRLWGKRLRDTVVSYNLNYMSLLKYIKKLQPLDRAIFGPLQKAINTPYDNCMRSNSGRVMTIYDIPSIA